jgi:gliding motility-associated lipoprotein GldD
VDEHQVKASKILDKTFIFPKKKVYCTFFELQGNVATNFQFYITDSSTRFVRGELLMNCRPNYDSLRPVLNYIQKDLEHMIETFEWK